MAAVEVPPLIEILAEIPDPRESQGKRHSLAGILALACVATLCGYQNPHAIAEWGRNYGEKYASLLGFERHGYPATSSWYRILSQVDASAIEAVLTGWCERVLTALNGQTRVSVRIDGKTLRGSKRQGASNSHLLSAYAADIGMVLARKFSICFFYLIDSSCFLNAQYFVIVSFCHASYRILLCHYNLRVTNYLIIKFITCLNTV